jgi:hypothetical protein
MAVHTSHRATDEAFCEFDEPNQYSVFRRAEKHMRCKKPIIQGFGEKYRSEMAKISCKIFGCAEPA